MRKKPVYCMCCLNHSLIGNFALLLRRFKFYLFKCFFSENGVNLRDAISGAEVPVSRTGETVDRNDSGAYNQRIRRGGTYIRFGRDSIRTS